jgi:hypothetical protein
VPFDAGREPAFARLGLLAAAFFGSSTASCARLRFKVSIRLMGFSPGVLQGLGLGYEVMKSIRPDIIYTDISRAYGSQGRTANQPATFFL